VQGVDQPKEKIFFCPPCFGVVDPIPKVIASLAAFVEGRRLAFRHGKTFGFDRRRKLCILVDFDGETLFA